MGQTIGKVISGGVDAPPEICQPTILELPTGSFGEQLPNAAFWTFTYRINGGAIQTHEENAFDVNFSDVLVNFLGYYGLFGSLVTEGYGHNGQAAFFVGYNQPIQGGAIDDPYLISVEQNTIELLVNPNVQYDAVNLIFGRSITLHSCARINWRNKSL